MTTKRSSNNSFGFTFRQGVKSLTAAVAVIMCGAISFLTTFFSLYELFTESAVYDENGTITGFVANKDSFHFLIFQEAEYLGQILLMIIAACGVLAAICSFNFITSKKMVNVYYSLGITRTKLFCGKYFSGLVLLFIAVFLPMLVTFIGNVAAVGYSASLLKAVLFYFLDFLLVAFTSFTLTSAVFAVVGTTFETAVFSAIILFIPDIFLYCIQELMSTFLYGNPYGQEFMFANSYNYGYGYNTATLPKQLSFLSPVFWGQEQMKKYAVAEKVSAKDAIPEIAPDFLTALLWLGICVAVFLLAVFFFNRRKAEICGFIGTNRWLNTTVSMLAAFAVFCVIVSFVEEFYIALAVGALGFAIVHLLLEIIVLRDLKKFAKGLYKLPIGIAVSVAVIFMFNSGLFGFSQKIPDISEIESVAVTYTGIASEYGLYSDGYSFATSDLDYFAYSNSIVGEFTTEDDIKAVLDAHKTVAESSDAEVTSENEIQFVYTLKNGKTLKRSFDSVSAEGYKKILYLEDCDYYDEILNEYFNGKVKEIDLNYAYGSADNSRDVVFAEAQTVLRDSYSIGFYSTYADKVYTVHITESDKVKLLDALYEDIRDRTAQEKYYPSETPLAYIEIANPNGYYEEYGMVYTEPAEGESTVTESDFSKKYSDLGYTSQYSPTFFTHITSDMAKTVQVLKDMGLFEKLTAVPEFVSAEIVGAQEAFDATIGKEPYTVQYYSKFFKGGYSSVTSTISEDWSMYSDTLDTLVNGTTVKDADKINALMKCSYTFYEQDDYSEGWFVSFKTADGGTVLCYIPDGKLPSGII